MASFMISFVDSALVEAQTSPSLLSVLRCVIVFAMQKRCPSKAVIRPSCFVETTLSRRQFRLPVKNNAHVCNRGSERFGPSRPSISPSIVYLAVQSLINLPFH